MYRTILGNVWIKYMLEHEVKAMDKYFQAADIKQADFKFSK